VNDEYVVADVSNTPHPNAANYVEWSFPFFVMAPRKQENIGTPDLTVLHRNSPSFGGASINGFEGRRIVRGFVEKSMAEDFCFAMNKARKERLEI